MTTAAKQQGVRRHAPCRSGRALLPEKELCRYFCYEQCALRAHIQPIDQHFARHGAIRALGDLVPSNLDPSACEGFAVPSHRKKRLNLPIIFAIQGNDHANE